MINYLKKDLHKFKLKYFKKYKEDREKELLIKHATKLASEVYENDMPITLAATHLWKDSRFTLSYYDSMVLLMKAYDAIRVAEETING
jgi:hypothetical protein